MFFSPFFLLLFFSACLPLRILFITYYSLYMQPAEVALASECLISVESKKVVAPQMAESKVTF